MAGGPHILKSGVKQVRIDNIGDFSHRTARKSYTVAIWLFFSRFLSIYCGLTSGNLLRVSENSHLNQVFYNLSIYIMDNCVYNPLIPQKGVVMMKRNLMCMCRMWMRKPASCPLCAHKQI